MIYSQLDQKQLHVVFYHFAIIYLPVNTKCMLGNLIREIILFSTMTFHVN
jgi:hypothetical protein